MSVDLLGRLLSMAEKLCQIYSSKDPILQRDGTWWANVMCYACVLSRMGVGCSEKEATNEAEKRVLADCTNKTNKTN